MLPGYSGVANTSQEVAAAMKVVGYYGNIGTASHPGEAILGNSAGAHAASQQTVTLIALGQNWGSGTRRCRGRPTATHFLLLRQKESKQRKGDPQSGPCASLRVPCGAQTQWGHVQTRLRLKQARALIHWVLRSSAQPGRDF